jgi:hypothetical protein
MYFRSLKKFLEVFGKSRKGKRVYSTMGRIWPIGLDTVDARPAQLGQGPPSGRIAHASGGRRVRALGAVTVPLAGTVARRVMTPRRLTRDEVVSSRRRGTRGAHQETREAVAFFGEDGASTGGGRPRGSLKHQEDESEVRGGDTSGSHRRGGLTAVVAPDLSLPMVDSMGEADKRGAVSQGRWWRGSPWLVSCGGGGSKRGARDGFPIEAERKKEGEAGPGWESHVEK